ncbi:hypothetical protein O181_123691 [Austropuccinia psidii MF-1]|uniref:Uncharacterized protein n=1 Tax=Austropuccinia psidii MF-1 TaxID=1389203 RepID=A0A9Q3KPQ3_9BASI|nr:hypothetical protein [Austropuccinia psidii MF-1]
MRSTSWVSSLALLPKNPTSDALPLPMPTAIGQSTIGPSNASTPGLSQRSNDIGQDGAESLLTRPAPFIAWIRGHQHILQMEYNTPIHTA